MFGKKRSEIAVVANRIQESNIPAPDQLEGKLRFLQINQEDLDRLKQLDPLLKQHVESITERHYLMLSEFSHLMNIIEDNTTIERLSDSFRRYLLSLSKGEVSSSYFKEREKIGSVHSKIGLAPEWYTGSYLRLYEFMVPAIIHAYAKQPHEQSAMLLALIKLVTLDSQIVLESYQEANDYKIIDRLGNVLELVMQIDKIKHVLDTVETTTHEAHNVQVAAEQLAGSVHQVANSAGEVAHNATTTLEQASAGKEIIQSSLNSFLTMTTEFEGMQNKINNLLDSLQSVSEIVQVIRNVADQTNLLALNASIEAARAGEHGRGFAVVAEEVRKLAEQTKQSIHTITSTIETVQSEANQVDQTAADMSQHFSEKVAQTRDAISLLDDIVSHIQNVSQSTGHIAAISQEQAAATSSMTDRITQVQSNMDQITQNVSHAGQNVYDIGAAINDLHRVSVAQTNHLKTKHYLRIVKTDHLLWKWWLYNFMLGYHQIEENDLTDHLHCRLGTWYEEEKHNPAVSSLSAFQRLAEPHRRFHDTVREIFTHVKTGKQQAAESSFRSLEEISDQVLSCLDDLVSELR